MLPRRAEVFVREVRHWLAERGWKVDVSFNRAEGLLIVGQEETPFCLYVQDWDLEFADMQTHTLPWVKETIERWHRLYHTRRDSLSAATRQLLARYFGSVNGRVQRNGSGET